jgi:hypothetical protein
VEAYLSTVGKALRAHNPPVIVEAVVLVIDTPQVEVRFATGDCLLRLQVFKRAKNGRFCFELQFRGQSLIDYSRGGK